jgi:hypothetical protein
VIGVMAVPSLAQESDPPDGTVACHDGVLARQRTEIDTDITVPQFDPALGTLLEVSVPGQSVHLDTSARFENTAQSSVAFEEHATYQVVLTSPGGLASPPALTGSIERVPPQTLAAFDGTLDYQGPSAVVQPTTTSDETAVPVSATDDPTLGAFTGTGTVAFHVATTISETFTGGGGNVFAEIETFASASIQVCYRYEAPPPPAPPEVKGEVVEQAPPPAAGPTLPATGRATGPLAGAGVLAVAVGSVLVRRGRVSRPRLDLG